MNATDALFHQPAAQAVGWALLHFVWQGAVVAALTGAVAAGAATQRRRRPLRCRDDRHGADAHAADRDRRSEVAVVPDRRSGRRGNTRRGRARRRGRRDPLDTSHARLRLSGRRRTTASAARSRPGRRRPARRADSADAAVRVAVGRHGPEPASAHRVVVGPAAAHARRYAGRRLVAVDGGPPRAPPSPLAQHRDSRIDARGRSNRRRLDQAGRAGAGERAGRLVARSSSRRFWRTSSRTSGATTIWSISCRRSSRRCSSITPPSGGCRDASVRSARTAATTSPSACVATRSPTPARSPISRRFVRGRRSRWRQTAARSCCACAGCSARPRRTRDADLRGWRARPPRCSSPVWRLVRTAWPRRRPRRNLNRRRS